MAWQHRQIEPQPARGKLVESMWDDPNWIAEEKYDGDRRIAQFCGPLIRFTGRLKSVESGLFVEKTFNVPHLSGQGDARRVAPKGQHFPMHPAPRALEGTVLDGEMIAAQNGKTLGDLLGGMSKFVTSIMGSLPEEAVRKQIERGWLRYVVFDCLFYRGRDIRGLPAKERHLYLEQARIAWGNPFILGAAQERDDKRAFLRSVLSSGGEGVILKHLDHRYGNKNGWVKVKAEWTADVVIMGFIPAKEVSKKVSGEVSMTKYAKAGLIGAIQCGQYRRRRKDEKHDFLEEVATVSGMDDGLRKDFTEHPKKFIGRVIEIAHNGVEPTGRFRHPRFKRFRDDKAAKDCIYREGEI